MAKLANLSVEIIGEWNHRVPNRSCSFSDHRQLCANRRVMVMADGNHVRKGAGRSTRGACAPQKIARRVLLGAEAALLCGEERRKIEDRRGGGAPDEFLRGRF